MATIEAETYDSSITPVLEELRGVAAIEGLAVLDLVADTAEVATVQSVGIAGETTFATGRLLMMGQAGRPTHLVAGDGRPLLACPWVMPPSRPGGLLLWRAPGAPTWTKADHIWVACVALLVRKTIASTAGQVGIDPLTGVPNRRWFIDEADRRAERMDHEGGVASVLLIDIDNLRRVNTSLGREAGDRVLMRLASQLRAMVRPSDLVARVGPDEFALWQDGMDHLTAAERADALCKGRQFRLAADDVIVTLSIGIASRRPGTSDDVRSLLRRAHMAAYEVKSQGGGGWRVS
jgi:diguanylate cyclase (GGDEF)-like protein